MAVIFPGGVYRPLGPWGQVRSMSGNFLEILCCILRDRKICNLWKKLYKCKTINPEELDGCPDQSHKYSGGKEPPWLHSCSLVVKLPSSLLVPNSAVSQAQDTGEEWGERHLAQFTSFKSPGHIQQIYQD